MIFKKSTWSLCAIALCAFSTQAAELRVLKSGLGSGTVTSVPVGINCGATCTATFGSVDVQLTATADMGSRFVGWDQDADAEATTPADCTGTSNTCMVSLSVARRVRPVFRLDPDINPLTSFAPADIAAYLANPANANVNTPARFIKALPDQFKRNWILMSRSESLQTGTAASPRILLPSADAKAVFTIGMTTHSSYPGAHPNAIEFMQWDAATKNFRFHEIVLDTILAMGNFGMRTRGITVDDAKCFQCHSTRNVLNRSTFPGTTGVTPGAVPWKNKPNWDTYDSWGGMLPFNRDRIYQGSVEAAAFRKLFNPWTWSGAPSVRAMIEQLNLQPPGTVAADSIKRLRGGENDGRVKFAFDPVVPPAVEPAPTSSGTGLEAPIDKAYSFDGVHGTGAPTTITRGGAFVHLRHTSDVTSTGVGAVEGRGVQLFDILGGFDGDIIDGVDKPLNAQRIAHELITQRFATGSVGVDLRPVALALTKLDTDGQTCIRISGGAITTRDPMTAAVNTTILDFLRARNGTLTIADVVADTNTRWAAASPATPETRTRSMPRRKADLQRFNLDRTGDYYVFSPENGLLQEYGSLTTVAPGDTLLDRVRKEIFRRPNDLGAPDGTVMNSIVMGTARGHYVDREDYAYNANRVALYRYFLEPLGVSVDKWAMGVRGRSRTYTFADVFSKYTGFSNTFVIDLEASLTSEPFPSLAPPFSCASLINAVNTTLAPFPALVDDVPKYTDVQRIFNKACIECHGGLGYPPYGTGFIDLSEDENPPAMTPPLVSPRLARSYNVATALTTTDPATSLLYQKIIDSSEACSSMAIGMMPCGGPPLSKVDIETIRRWIVGAPPAVPSRPSTNGDPHLKTVDGVNYDFQSAGEFVLLRDEGLEIQARQTAIETTGPLGANAHTGLVSCASLNSAAAVRLGPHRITYQPNLSGRPDPEGMQLRIDGKLARLGPQGMLLENGGRVVATNVRGGIQIEAPGGAVIVLTPAFWDHYQVWYMNIDVRNARAREGVIGAIARGSWLPAMPDGTSLGPKPRDLHQRYVDLYERFEDAWRVTDATSLFDYAPGTSTSSFTIRDWPLENPQNCAVPQIVPGGPVKREPLTPIALGVAEQHCAAIRAPDRKSNCVADVMVTGEPGFARIYAFSEQLDSNAAPTAPTLAFPSKDAALTLPIDFRWTLGADADGDGVTTRHCIWKAGERPTFAKCDLSPSAPQLDEGRRCIVLVILILGLILVFWLFVGGVHKGGLWALVVLALLIALLLAVTVGRIGAQSGSKSIRELEAGKAYYWKVIAEDGSGGTTESETRRFTVK